MRLANAPPFMRDGYAPFSRSAAVAVALREWRGWGAGVNDDPPGSRPAPRGEDKLERQDGYWQRVGEYWWTTLSPDQMEAGWTGRHGPGGFEIPAGRDGDYAWSAAFIRYVLYSAGAGRGLPAGLSHAGYIQAAVQMPGTARMRAHAIGSYGPQEGDLICFGRGNFRSVRLENMPAGGFPSHCDIVVRNDGRSIAVVGGNVDDAVTMKNVPVDEQGRIGDALGRPYDTRYPWFAVIEVAYER